MNLTNSSVVLLLSNVYVFQEVIGCSVFQDFEQACFVAISIHIA